MKPKYGIIAGYLAAASLILAVLPARSTALPHMQRVRLKDNVTPSLVQSSSEQIHQAIPVKTAPKETVPVETTPKETIPVETTPKETVPAETTPKETIPVETTPKETVPAEATPKETSPVMAISEKTEPETTVPEETEPETTISAETEPKTTVPEETEPETTIAEETEPETTVPEETEPETTIPEETEPPRIIYEIPEDALFAPKPNKALYGETNDPEVLRELIAQAETLLDGQSLYFTPELERMPESTVHYYLDDSILAIVWKEVVDSSALTMAEVKLAHPSQFRRHLSGGSFGSVQRYLTSEMSEQVNAVVATSADFYAYRPIGVVVVDGVAEKMEPGLSDTCYINDQGDMILELDQPFTTLDELQAYVDENNIQFSLSFGPALVKDGVALEVPNYYPVGEIDREFSRAGLCQMGKLHYLSVAANYEGKYWATMTVKRFAEVLAETGCTQAYTLDGGQTATITLDNKVINFVNYGAERLISDIIYFATAIPEQE